MTFLYLIESQSHLQTRDHFCCWVLEHCWLFWSWQRRQQLLLKLVKVLISITNFPHSPVWLHSTVLWSESVSPISLVSPLSHCSLVSLCTFNNSPASFSKFLYFHSAPCFHWIHMITNTVSMQLKADHKTHAIDETITRWLNVLNPCTSSIKKFHW